MVYYRSWIFGDDIRIYCKVKSNKQRNLNHWIYNSNPIFNHRGMRSKRIARLEHQLSENIKTTQHRIWNGVTKDVGYLRRILNELYLIKFKV